MRGPPIIAPATYARWRSTTLGRVTEELELALVLEFAGDLGGRRVLDIGTGDGTYAIAAAMRGANATGIDTSSAMLSTAAARAREQHVDVRVRQGSIEQLPCPDGSFDVVVAVTVLCLVDDPRRAMNEMARVLAPGGTLVVGELHRLSTWAAWRRFKGWFGSPTWKATHFWTKGELVKLVEDTGLAVVQVRGAIHYAPVGLAARLTRRIDPMLGRARMPGAAFLAIAARKR